jgi:hypothetical protein
VRYSKLHTSLTDVIPASKTLRNTFGRWTSHVFHTLHGPKQKTSISFLFLLLFAFFPPYFRFIQFAATYFSNMHEIMFSGSIKFQSLFSLFSSRLHWFLWPFSLHHNSSFFSRRFRDIKLNPSRFSYAFKTTATFPCFVTYSFEDI